VPSSINAAVDDDLRRSQALVNAERSLHSGRFPMVEFAWSWCYVVVDELTGFASIRDRFDGVEAWESDSLEEALEWLASYG
jgi:hypothetical protein